MFQAVLYIWHPVGQDPTGQHGAQDCALWIYLMLLQPAEVKHSIVRNPCALNLKEVVKFDLFFRPQCPHVDDNGVLPRRGQLEQSQAANGWLEPCGFHVKRNEICVVKRVEMLDALENAHAW